MTPFLHNLTGLGNSVVTLPIAAAMLVWLAIWCGRRPALAWLVGLVACGAVTALLKVYFHACPVHVIDLKSPSGHTSMSLFVYGGLTIMTAFQSRGWRRVAIAIGGGILVAGIALSRLALAYHSRAEVAIGLTVGGLALVLFWLPFRRTRPPRMPLWPLWIAALVPIFLLHGTKLPTESLLTRLALYLHGMVDFCA